MLCGSRETKHLVVLVVRHSVSYSKAACMDKYMKHAYALAILLVLLPMYFANNAQCKWQIARYHVISILVLICVFPVLIFQYHLLGGRVVVYRLDDGVFASCWIDQSPVCQYYHMIFIWKLMYYSLFQRQNHGRCVEQQD